MNSGVAQQKHQDIIRATRGRVEASLQSVSGFNHNFMCKG